MHALSISNVRVHLTVKKQNVRQLMLNVFVSKISHVWESTSMWRLVVGDCKSQIHSRSLDVLLDRLSKVYGSEPRSPWILSVMNNARHLEDECTAYLVVQTQRIVHLQVCCRLRLAPRYRETRYDKALIVTPIGGPHLLQQQLRELPAGTAKQFDGYTWHLVG